MFCKKCGKQIPDTTKFCPYCGGAVQPVNNLSGRGSQRGNNGNRNHRSSRSSKKTMMPFLVICGIIIAVAVMVTAAFVFKKIKDKDSSDETEVEEAIEESSFGADGAGAGDEKAGEETAGEPEESAAVETEPVTEAATEPVSEAMAETETQMPAAALPQVPDTTQYPTYYVVNCEEWISLRSEPRTSAAVLKEIPYGSPVSYVETAENGFYKIIYNGQTGYGLASYLSTTQPEPRNYAAASSQYYTAKVVNCEEWISLRAAPDTQAERITAIPLGSYVTVLSTNASGGFWKIRYNGYEGYALGQYLSIQ